MAHQVSPDIYKIVGEDHTFRVMLATWIPGASDQWHIHKNNLTNYAVTDCEFSVESPSGEVWEVSRTAGSVGFNPCNTAHRVTNIGSKPCTLLIVENKLSN